MRRALLALALSACGNAGLDAPASPAAPAPAASAANGSSDPAAQSRAAVAALVGTTPPEWHAERWMNSPPLELAKLRGSVVMVRWWTAGCPFCSTTAPALRTFDREYGPRGLRVIGMYHHKEDTPFDPKVYEETAKKYEFTFPVAVDPGWHTLESWLRDASGHEVSTGWTSVTFLLDKHGVIRHVHPGGSYVEGEPAYAEMRANVERLLAE
ncbi:MAG: TlpA family protein disulfide reductase [Myxococcales bacterium]|nr:TlpA family protein disulfide reductase [Myxococcales bacterium]